jgi:AAA+ ATPase superfamily predicted ATPase
MKIKETDSNIKINGAKFNTGDRPKQLSPFLPYVNMSLIIGLPASGKSSLIKSLLNGTKQNNLYNDVFHSVYYISPSGTMDLNLPEEKMISLADEPLERILEDIIENESGQGEEDEHHHALIILDDAVNYINTNRNAMNIFRKICMNGRHILGNYSSLMTMLVSQKIKAIPAAIRSQANSIYFFNSTRQEKEVLRDEFLPLDKQEANQLYEYVFDRPHNFLFVNLSMPKNIRNFKNFNQLKLENID